MPRDAERDVLVVELLGGFGDLLLALPMVHALARSRPNAAVRVLTFEPGARLLAADPHVAEVVAVPERRPGGAGAAVAAELRRRRPDLAVSTTRTDGIPALLAAGAERAVSDLWRDPPADELVDRRFLRLLAADGVIDPRFADLGPRVNLIPRERADGRRTLAAALGQGGQHAAPVVLVTDAGMAVKRWPLSRWRELAVRLRAAGCPVVTPARSASTAPPGTDDLAEVPQLPALPLRGLAAVLAAAGEHGGVVVGGDSGPVRLASAVGTPAVGLYGPTLASRYGLSGARVRNMQGLPSCPVRRPTSITEQECWWDGRCPLSSAGPACLADIPLDRVAAAVAALLA